jgi:hypothetical protein
MVTELRTWRVVANSYITLYFKKGLCKVYAGLAFIEMEMQGFMVMLKYQADTAALLVSVQQSVLDGSISYACLSMWRWLY